MQAQTELDTIRGAAPAPQAGPPPLPSLLGPALWRTRRGRQFLIQVAGFLLILGVVLVLSRLMAANLARQNLNLGWDFLQRRSGVDISESFTGFAQQQPLWRMLVAGAVNSVVVSVLCIVLSTVIGLVVGVLRVSSNPLLRVLTGSYVDVIRNTPLLLQLLLWYSILMMMPPVRQAFSWGDVVFLSLRGVHMPRLIWTGGTLSVLLAVGLGALACALVIWRRRGRRGRYALGLLTGLLSAIAVLMIDGGYHWEIPVLKGFNFVGGMTLTPEITALTIGVSLYTGAFIAELVRGGIQGVARGQREAGESLGLSRMQVMRLVILPQAMLAIIPPMTTQYVGVLKASSLGIAVGYPDFFFTINSSSNLSGHSIENVAIMLAGYVGSALAIAWVMNRANAALLRKGQR